MKEIGKLLKSKLFIHDLQTMSPQYKDEFVIDITTINITRIKTIIGIIIYANILLLIVDIFKFRPLWETIPNYKYLFYAHIFIIVALVIYRFIILQTEKHFSKKQSLQVRVYIRLIILMILIVMGWCAFLSINAQRIHGQISAYTIGIFCLSSLLILNPKTIFVIYGSIYIFFISGLLMVNNSAQSFSGNIINVSLLTVLAISISIIRFSAYVKDFCNKKVIVEKTKALNNSHSALEEAVQNRTKELSRANEMLIREMELRHAAEIETLKNKHLYEKENRKLQEAIEYEELRTIFFANISHELRTPLNVIFSAQQMLKRLMESNISENNQDKMHKYIAIIRQNCYRLIRLLNNLIDITKMDAGCFEIRLANHDIVKIVEDITLSVIDYVEDKNITLIFDTEIEEKIIACDPDKIERIILNLLSNSVKFTPPEGEIRVTMYQKKEKIVVSVKDSGIGIPSEMHEKIFERFTQVDNSIRKNKEGSGIGLSLVKKLIEMHNGGIALLSQEGEGSEFIIEFPDRVVKQNNENTRIEANRQVNENQEDIRIEFSDIYF